MYIISFLEQSLVNQKTCLLLMFSMVWPWSLSEVTQQGVYGYLSVNSYLYPVK